MTFPKTLKLLPGFATSWTSTNPRVISLRMQAPIPNSGNSRPVTLDLTPDDVRGLVEQLNGHLARCGMEGK